MWVRSAEHLHSACTSADLWTYLECLPANQEPQERTAAAAVATSVQQEATEDGGTAGDSRHQQQASRPAPRSPRCATCYREVCKWPGFVSAPRLCAAVEVCKCCARDDAWCHYDLTGTLERPIERPGLMMNKQPAFS